MRTLFFVMVLSSSVRAADYYVAPNGNDGAEGTLSAPWKTIGKSNAALQPGDRVFIRSGNYMEVIDPANNGNAQDKIIYAAYPGETPAIRGNSATVPLAKLTKAHIVLDGLRFDRASKTTIKLLDVDITGNYNEIRNCHFYNAEDSLIQGSSKKNYDFIRISRGDYTLIEGNLMERSSGGGIKLTDNALHATIRNNTIKDSFGDAIRLDSTNGILQGTLIEGNLFSGSRVTDGVQFNSVFNSPDYATNTGNRGVVIRGNIMTGNAENGIDLKGASDILIEKNIIHGNIGNNDGMGDGVADRNAGGGAITHGSGTASKNIIIRRNIIYDNNNGAKLEDGWMIYNNTIINNNRDYTGPNSAYRTNGNPAFTNIRGSPVILAALKNNIIMDSNAVQVAMTSATRVDIAGNLYYDTLPSAFTLTKTPWASLNFSQWKSLLQASNTVIGDEAESLEANPKFVKVPNRPTGDPSQFDFHLSPGSPAIDAGVPLTSTAGGGSGNRITLRNAGYFSWGFGAVTGDAIMIGSDTATITAIDYATNVITIDRTIQWENNDPIGFPYAGSGPDIGALESSPVISAPAPPVGLKVLR